MTILNDGILFSNYAPLVTIFHLKKTKFNVDWSQNFKVQPLLAVSEQDKRQSHYYNYRSKILIMHSLITLFIESYFLKMERDLSQALCIMSHGANIKQ